jgi:hypothetical protein
VNYAQAIINILPTYIAMGEGYILFDHGTSTVEELSRDVIGFANDLGFGNDTPDDLDWLAYVEDKAIDYLNDLAPEGAWFGHDGEVGAFGCWPITEDDA